MLGGASSVASLSTTHEQTQSNRVLDFILFVAYGTIQGPSYLYFASVSTADEQTQSEPVCDFIVFVAFGPFYLYKLFAAQ